MPRDEVPCPLCDKGPFVDLVQHGAQYGGRTRNLPHIEMAADILRGTLEARNTVTAQLAQEVNDDDSGNGDPGGDGAGDGQDGDGDTASIGDRSDSGDGTNALAKYLS